MLALLAPLVALAHSAGRQTLTSAILPHPAPCSGYWSENIVIHEFGHAIHIIGLGSCQQGLLTTMHQAAYSSGAYDTSTYMMSNDFEYFAVRGQRWPWPGPCAPDQLGRRGGFAEPGGARR